MSQVSQTPSAARGAALETLLAGHFTRHGYAVESNLVVEGRSGNAHELDVVARRSDALTDYVTVVEAKSWSNRVGKEVVAKLAYVLADVGMHKGIIAAPGGLTSGAITAAEALGIEVWDGAELERRLGATALADAADGRGESRQPATLTVTGDHHRISQA
ncbi:restriction endonuclease, partial [Candidatus Neomicrothrix sp.]